MPRRNFPATVKVEAFKRAMAAGGLCEGGCGRPLRTGRFEYHHVVPDAMGGKPVLSNCMLLCTEEPNGGCHGLSTRTVDVPAIARAKRLEAKRLDAGTPAARPMPAGKKSSVKLTVDRRVVAREPSRPRRSALSPKFLFQPA